MTQHDQPQAVNKPFSPCNSICELDEDVGICRGCGRTIAEISNWLKFDDAARDAVCSELPARLQKLQVHRP